MALLTATISGQLLRPDLAAGAMRVYIHAVSDGERLAYNGKVIAGRVPVEIGRNGHAKVTIPQMPQTGLTPDDARWRLVFIVGNDRSTFDFTLTGDATWDDLVDVSNVPLTSSLVAEAEAARDAALSAVASVAYSTWQPTTSYVAGQTVQAPTGELIRSKSTRTSRSSFDSTEISNWVPISAYTPAMFGAPLVYSGVFDDTTYIQAAITNAIGDGKPLLLPRVYNQSAPVTATGSLNMYGLGRFDPSNPTTSMVSGFIAQFANADLLVINGDGCTLRDFGIAYSGATPTAGAGVKLQKSWGARITGLGISNLYKLIESQDVDYGEISNCLLLDPVLYGVYFNNTAHPDNGDYTLAHNNILTFNQNRVATSAVRWEAGGGLKSRGNKINGDAKPGAGVGSFDYGLDIRVNDSAATGEITSIGDTWSWINKSQINVTTLGPNNTGTVSKVVVDDCIGLGAASTAKVATIGTVDGAHANNIREVTFGPGNSWYGFPAGGIFVTYARSVKIDKQMWAENNGVPTGPLIQLGDSALDSNWPTHVEVDAQAIGYNSSTGAQFDGIDIVKDYRDYGNTENFSGQLKYENRRGVNIATAAGTQTQTLWQVEMGTTLQPGTTKCAALLEVIVAGQNISSQVPIMLKQRRTLTNGGHGTITVATVDTDNTNANDSGTCTLVYDTTTAGIVKIILQSTNVGSGALRGLAEIRVVGTISRLHKGA